jgi:hypothetical protein
VCRIAQRCWPFGKMPVSAEKARVATMWPSIEQATYRQGGLVSPLAFLTRYGFERLVRAVNAIEQVAATMEVIDALPPGRALSLALASPSNRVGFCVTMRSRT